ncbi:thioredoxin family protein [Brevibacillus dissolubilis]|uniref:thioredoxin family protein n=1 Tax=Brevibacillus dissolubilis TaxID=1844116 RepID=UPI00159BBE64|nr:thioredoxin family protein [Brevibacillus dissolubilis]
MGGKIKTGKLFLGIALLIVAALLVISQISVREAESKIVYIYSSSCGYCDSFLPKFNKVVSELPGINVERWDVSADTEGYRVARELGAKVTPTVFLLRKSVVVDKLEGDVTEQEAREFLQKAISLKR